MKAPHYIAVAMALSSVGLQLQHAASWHQALSPAGVGALLLGVAGVVTALFSDKVQR